MLYQGLEAEKLRRQQEIDRLSKQILALWDRLEITPEERKSFSKQVGGITLEIISKVNLNCDCGL